MNKREKRVIKAFINCVKSGEYTFEYACILIEDSSKYGWITEEAKEIFYAEFETEEEVQATKNNAENTAESTENIAENTENVENVDNTEESGVM